jgi:hypothetical protein
MQKARFLLLMGGIFLVQCTHHSLVHYENRPSRDPASHSPNRIVEFPGMGLTIVIKEKTQGLPVAAIFDKNGEYYPELQNKINKKLKASALVDMIILSTEVIPENRLYEESKERYATLIIQAKTLNALNKKEQMLKFAVPMERMMIAQKGGKATGLGYWNTTDVRPLDPQQKLPF